MALHNAKILRETLQPSHQDPHREKPQMSPEMLQGMLQVMMAKIARVNAEARLRATERTLYGKTDPSVVEDD